MVSYSIDIRILHILVPRTSIKGIPETMVGRILMFVWSFGALQWVQL